MRRLISVSVLVAVLLSLTPVGPSASESLRHSPRSPQNMDQRSWVAGLQSYAALGNWLLSKLPGHAKREPEMTVAPPVTAYLNPAPFFIDAPTSLTVTAASNSSVSLSWTAPAGFVDHYQVERSQTISGPFLFVANSATTSFNDTTVSSAHAYLYRVRAAGSGGVVSGPSNMALCTAVSFEFSALTNQLIKAQHFYDVRMAVNAVRAAANLSAATWNHSSLGGLVVEANDVQELRNKLDEALTALSITVTAYQDPTLSTGANGTLIKAIHLEQLQARSTKGSSNSSGPLDSDSATARLDPLNETGGGSENPLSRNFNWDLPFLSLPGRAGLDLSLALSYNSLVWTKSGANNISFDDDHGFPGPGFRLGFPVIQPLYYNVEVGKYAFLLLSPDGSRTELRQVGTSALYEAADSSHMLLDSSTMVLRTTGGTQFSYTLTGSEYNCTQIKDRNGNYISATYTANGHLDTVTDTLGRVITFSYDANGLLTEIKQVWNQNSTPVTHYWARFEYANISIDYNFGSLTAYGLTDNSTLKTLSRVKLADDSYFDFSYSSWGQVWKVSAFAADNHLLNYRSYNLPQTAGTTAYDDCPRFTERRDWAQYWNGDTDGTTATNEEAVTAFAVPVSDTWTMPNSTQLSGMRAQVTEPDGTSNKIYFIGSAGTSSGWQRGLVALVNTYDSGAALQRQSMTTWTQDNTAISYPLNPRVTETNVYDPAGNRARTQTTYQQFTFANGTSCHLPQDVYEYAANASTILRSTRTDYNTSTSYTDRRILGLVSEKRLYDGDVNNGGTLASKVGFSYDESGSIQGSDAPVQHDNTNFSASFVTGRANLSSTKRYDVNNTALFTTGSVKFNTAGATLSSKDALNHEVTISYADSFSDGNNTRNTLAYATLISDPDGYSSKSKYNFDFGATTSMQTPQPNTTANILGPEQSFTFDAIGRLQQKTNLVSGAYTRFEYPLNQIRVDTYETLKDALSEAHSYRITDGAGRVIATATDHPGSVGGFSGQKTFYDVMGRVSKTSNPTETHAGNIPSQWDTAGDDAAAGWIYTEQTYDWKSRPLVTTNQDQTTKVFSYGGCGCAGGEVITVSDEGTIDGGVVKKRQRKMYSDELGRKVKSELLNWEGGSVYSATVITYNVRDQITLIRQYAGAEGSGTFQDTTRNYDGFGRLQSLHRPEQDAGTSTAWTYNADDTVSSVADARGAVTSYTYNARHLVTNISYSAPTPIPVPGLVTYAYDAVGNRTSMLDGSGSTTYQYDQLSHMNSESRLINGLSGTQTIGYTYTLSGGLKSLTDPQGRTVNYDYDRRGRLTGVTGSGYTNTSQFISNYQYRAWDAPKHFNAPAVEYGTTGSIDFSYNTRLQLTHFEWNKPYSVATVDEYKSDYQYYADGRIKFISDARLAPYEQELFHNFDRGYRYDHAGRLVTALTGDEARGGGTPDGPYKETYQYDVWNHMNNRVNRIWSKPLDTWTGNYINNRNHDPLSLWEYDADGNATRDDNGPSSFDAAGRKSSYGSSRYYIPTGAFNTNPTWNPSVTTNTYDGDGQLVHQLEAIGTDHFDAYFVRSTVLGGALILWTEVSTNSYYAPGWSSTLRFAPIYAGGERIAQSMDGNVTFEFEEPFTGRRRGVEPDPLGQPVGTMDPGPDEPADPGGYPEAHEFGNVEDPGGGCTMDGITIDCATAMRFRDQMSPRWTSLFLPRPWRPHVDLGRTPPTFPAAQSQTSLGQVLREVVGSAPFGGIFFPGADDLMRFVNPTFFSPPQDPEQEPDVLRFWTWAPGDKLLALMQKIRQALCRAVPRGRVSGVSGTFGLVGGPTGGVELVQNYRSGQISGFAFGGTQVGWNGGAGGNGYTGFVWGLDDSNANYSGGFSGVNGQKAVGLNVQSSSGGLTGSARELIPNPRQVTSVALTAGGSLIPTPTGGASVTNYTKPLQLGKWWMQASNINWIDTPLIGANQLCR